MESTGADRLTAAQAAAALGVSERRVRQIADRLGGEWDEPAHRLLFSRALVEEAAEASKGRRPGPESTNDLLREILGELRQIRGHLTNQEPEA